ncbi:peroxide stress protein YaaA [Corynebacterium uropygiale]|uniref:Peroxide stress protein YaaA n=1 Tax=Corynebacterium uropygiale TaxID=1775911 RepID=A0A9X1QPG0_9CORY|nr:peroxide stress protein YaaA [Corynebacterium uropygiale]MCF4006406.1 peroxide stress protein YaaA [Corynebacterium uropygiale]
MLIILPPSEAKADGGDLPPLDLDRLHFSSLTPVREEIIEDLLALEPLAMQRVLKLSDRLWSEVEANIALRDSPCTPALRRYTGVLYDALDAEHLPPRAWERILLSSAMFGFLHATDPIPHYRLSGGSTLPRRDGGTATMKSRWSPTLSAAGAELPGLIIDARSGAYAQLGTIPGALTLTVMKEKPDGSRSVVSHVNKKYKGVLTRVLASAEEELESAGDVVDYTAEHGLHMEIPKDAQLHLIVRE